MSARSFLGIVTLVVIVVLIIVYGQIGYRKGLENANK